MQASFVRYVAADGLPLCKAAEAAGYSHPATAGSNVARLAHVRQAIYATRQAMVEGDLASLGLRTMRELMTDPVTPAPVRFQAARWSIEAAGHGAAARQAAELPASEKALHEMSVAELEAFIQRGDAALQGMRRIGGTIDIAQDNAQG